jgi:hypothetical protein
MGTEVIGVQTSEGITRTSLGAIIDLRILAKWFGKIIVDPI